MTVVIAHPNAPTEKGKKIEIAVLRSTTYYILTYQNEIELELDVNQHVELVNKDTVIRHPLRILQQRFSHVSYQRSQ